jgi:hypothetical protein
MGSCLNAGGHPSVELNDRFFSRGIPEEIPPVAIFPTLCRGTLGGGNWKERITLRGLLTLRWQFHRSRYVGLGKGDVLHFLQGRPKNMTKRSFSH